MLHHRLRAAPKVFELEFVQSLLFTTVSSGSLSATPQAGDLLVYCAGGVSSGLFVADPANVVPSNFKQIATHTEGNGLNYVGGRTTLAYKISTGDESTLSGFGIWSIIQFRATRAISAVTVVDSAGAWATGDPAAKSLNAPSALPAFGVAVYRHADAGSPTLTLSTTTQWPTLVNNGTYLRTKYLIFDTTAYTLSAGTSDLGAVQGFSAAVLVVE